MLRHSSKLQALLAAGSVAACVAYASPAQAQALSLRVAFDTPSDSGMMLGAVAVGNVAGDAALEIVVNSSQGIDVYDAAGTRISGFLTQVGSTSRPVNAPASLVDIDGDGVLEILFATGYESAGSTTPTNSVFAIRGADGAVLWEMPIDTSTYSTPESGYQTIAGKFYYEGAEHDTLPATTTFSASASPLPVYDLDGDGKAEVVVPLKIRPEPQDSNPYIQPIWGFAEWGTVGESWSGGNLLIDLASGGRSYIYHVCQLVEAGVALGVVDSAKGTAVFQLNDSDSVVGYHRSQPHGFFGAGNLIGQFGKNQRVQTGSYKAPVWVHAADITGDGRAEVLVTTHNFEHLWTGSRTILDDEGRILWRAWFDFPETTGTANHWPSAAQMIPINLDGGNAEVVTFQHTSRLLYEEWDGVELVAKPGWPVDFGAQVFPSPPAVGDVDGDGQEEFVVGVYNPYDLEAAGRLVVVGQDGATKQELPTEHGLKNAPNLADLDGDGHLEVIVRDLAGRVTVYSASGITASWPTDYRTPARIGGLNAPLYPPKAPVAGKVLTGWRRAQLAWEMREESGLTSFTVLRKRQGETAFSEIAQLASTERSFEDRGLDSGVRYTYHVESRFGDTGYRSGPMVALPLVENNLTWNAGFELNNDAFWDKWYTGDLPIDAMVPTSTRSHTGARSMALKLQSIEGDNSSIKQWNQYGVIDAQLRVVPGTVYSLGAFLRTNLDQGSEHWIEWNSSYDKYRHDPAGDPIPNPTWPDYFTTHARTPAGESDWLYVNRTFTLQDGVTALSPRHRFQVDAASNGEVYLDEVFLREVGTGADSATVILPWGGSWRYTDSDPGGSWFESIFDDSAWQQGQAKFGRGSGPKEVKTELPTNRDMFWFRGTFSHDASVLLCELVAYAMATPGPENGLGIEAVYLNGKWIPIQDPGLSREQGNTVRLLDLSPFLDWMVEGENHLAVRLANTWETGWDDVAFDFSLRAQACGPMHDPVPPTPDAGAPADAGIDAGEAQAPGTTDGGGCSCTAPRQGHSEWLVASLAGLAIAAMSLRGASSCRRRRERYRSG